MKVCRVSEIRALDKTATEAFGIVQELLMENAGHALYWVISDKFGVRDRRFLVCCGIGNNGGDGLVVARKIHSNGGHVQVLILGDPGQFKGAAKANFDIVSRLPIDVRRLESVESIKSDVRHCDAVVDAIFGTGLTRRVEGLQRDVIELINRSGKTVFAVDIPSGVHGDTGEIMGVAVKADFTVTFGLPKIGNMLSPGYALCGELYVSHISFPPSMYTAPSLKVEINHPEDFPPRYGSVRQRGACEALFIAGAFSRFGPPYFAALSFYKAGGAHSRLATPRSVIPAIACRESEIDFAPQEETASGSISLKNKATLLALSERMDMVVLGPGLSFEKETQQLIRELAGEIEKPLLLAGDGIAALYRDLQIITARKAETALILDLENMVKIAGSGFKSENAGSIDLLQHIAGELHAKIVLKQAHALIGYPDGSVFINTCGNSGLEKVGSEDVLAGAIAGMFGLGLPFDHAVRKGVFIHGLSGDLAAEEKGEDGLIARDIMDYLPLAVKLDRDAKKTFKRQDPGIRVV